MLILRDNPFSIEEYFIIWFTQSIFLILTSRPRIYVRKIKLHTAYRLIVHEICLENETNSLSYNNLKWFLLAFSLYECPYAWLFFRLFVCRSVDLSVPPIKKKYMGLPYPNMATGIQTRYLIHASNDTLTILWLCFCLFKTYASNDTQLM